MKVVILAGGFGTRLSEYTETIPKPMVRIGGKPIIWHIMKRYAKFGHKDFYIALGYKAEVIKEYFMNFHALNSNLTVNLKDGSVTTHYEESLDWNVTLIDTGLESMTGGRIKLMKKFIGDEPFLLTYGDGLSDVDIHKLIEFHTKHKKMITVSAVHPGARFGELQINDNVVTSFKEKPQINEGWINGGYFVVNPEFLELIENEKTILEKEPLEEASRLGQLMAYQHDGFWHCMDTKRDHEALENIWLNNHAPWA